MAFRVPRRVLGCVRWLGSFDVMCLGAELVGADLVLVATRVAFGQTHWVELVGGELAGGATGICRTWLGGVLC